MGKGDTTSTQTNDPWAQAIPYLTGDENTPGVLPDSASLYGQSQWTPEMQANLDAKQAYLNESTPGRIADITGLQGFLQGGQFDTSFNPMFSNLEQGRMDQGALDPTQSLQQLLSGQVNMDSLGAMNQANIGQSMQAYDDMLQKFNQSTMPGIGRDAQSAGQYGGSRQGIAEGLAGQQMIDAARDLTQSNVNAGNLLYGNAYENAQGRMGSAANALNAQAAGNQQFNAGQNINNLRATGQSNSGNLQNALAALGLGDQASGLQNSLFSQTQANQTAPQDFNWGALGNYANVVMPAAGLGGTTTGVVQENPGFLDILSGVGGLGVDIGGLVSGWGS